jgi:hypothetical protein
VAVGVGVGSVGVAVGVGEAVGLSAGVGLGEACGVTPLQALRQDSNVVLQASLFAFSAFRHVRYLSVHAFSQIAFLLWPPVMGDNQKTPSRTAPKTNKGKNLNLSTMV